MKPRNSAPAGRELLPLITEAAIDKKAEDIVILNLKGETGIADYFVICSGDNQHHTRAIRDSIVAALERRGVSLWHSEGEQDGRWVLVDFSDVVVHIMTPEVRRYYALEELWEPLDKKEHRSGRHA
jgi:ribosome-associated protein